MPEPCFGRLRRALSEQGISRTYADRLCTELHEHYLDVAADRRAAGDGPARAARTARRTLGSDAAIVTQVLARAELRQQSRWGDFIAELMHANSVSLGPHAAPAIARWSASIGLGAILTVGLLFALARVVVIGV